MDAGAETEGGKQAWGDDISPERQAELEALFQHQAEWVAKPDAERGESTFKGVGLSGADMFWLAARVLAGTGEVQAVEGQMGQLRQAQSLGRRLRLDGLHAEEAALCEVHLEGAHLGGAHLEGHVYGPDDEEDFRRVRRWVEDFPRELPPADLRDAFLDSATALTGVTLGTPGDGPGQGYVPVADVRWGGVNLAVVKAWPARMLLGDEREAWAWQLHRREDVAIKLPDTAAENPPSQKAQSGGRPMSKKVGQEKGAKAAQERLELFRAAVRANRQVATALRDQGMNEEADRFAYRAQVCQRRLFSLQRQWGRWFLQTLLKVLAGYGFRLGRIFAAYVLIVGLFAAAFLASAAVSSQAVPTVPQAFDALQISLNAIHGRVFFAQFHLDTVQSWLATAESIVGIVIEGVFVAMLVQRFFGGK